jgi:spoIIIJ-associated protein
MDAATLKTLTQTLLTHLDIAVDDIVVTSSHPGRTGRTIIAITIQDAKNLIGPNGDHLRALNMLARRLVEAEHGEEAANFLIDVNQYHEAQMEKVRDNARMLAQRARLFKRDVDMDPMSPYERLVVHELFAEDPEIKTVSEGEGKFRHIVLKYRSAQSQPAA